MPCTYFTFNDDLEMLREDGIPFQQHGRFLTFEDLEEVYDDYQFTEGGFDPTVIEGCPLTFIDEYENRVCLDFDYIKLFLRNHRDIARMGFKNKHYAKLFQDGIYEVIKHNVDDETFEGAEIGEILEIIVPQDQVMTYIRDFLNVMEQNGEVKIITKAYLKAQEKVSNFIFDRMFDTKYKVGRHFFDFRLKQDGIDYDDDLECECCGTTCLDHKANKGRGIESPCEECGEIRCGACACDCE